MEAITRLVSESLARHGFDRPLDYRRLHWSRWFRCESLHSLLSVPSKPGVFAVAEEIVEFAPTHGGADAFVRPAEQSSAAASTKTTFSASANREGHDFSRATSALNRDAALAAEGLREPHENGSLNPQVLPRMLAVTQFFEDDDMAFVLDRMLTRQNPMRARLLTGRYFVRFVVIEDQSQRVSICAALNQWIANSGEKISGIGAHFASLAGAMDAHVATGASPVPRSEASGPGTVLGFPNSLSIAKTPQLDSGAATNIHCPHPLPSGF